MTPKIKGRDDEDKDNDVNSLVLDCLYTVGVTLLPSSVTEISQI